MAIDVKTGRDVRWGLFGQTAFGTAAAVSANAVTLDQENAQIDRDIKIVEMDTVHGNRMKTYSDVIHNAQFQMPKVPCNGPVNIDIIDFFLYGAMQKVVETATTPQKKVFTFHGTQPDFSTITIPTNSGYLFSLFKDHGSGLGDGWRIADCICDKLKLVLDRQGWLKQEASVVGNGSVLTGQTLSGTWTTPTLSPIYAGNIARATIDFGGAGDTNLVLDSFELEFGHNDVRLLGYDGSGGGQTYALADRFGTFTIKTLKDASTISALSAATAGTYLDVNFGWGNATPGTDDGDFDIAFTGKLTQDVEIDHDGPLGATLTGTILAADAATEGLTITMANGSLRSWPTS